MSEVASKAAFTLGGFFFCYDQPWIFDLPLPFCGVQFCVFMAGSSACLLYVWRWRWRYVFFAFFKPHTYDV